MGRNIKIDEALQINNLLFIDVRSESEFKEATIPGAVNLPILNDEERILVGNVYHQKNPQEARLLAVRLVSPKLPALIEQINKWVKQQPVALFCWRGGMRSHSMQTFCDLAGISVYCLSGGYKAYRRWVREYLWEQKLDRQVIVLDGLTGVGKTEILKILDGRGLNVIDLEELASNRGSVFGGIGLPPCPSQKMFESYLAEKLWRQRNSPYVLVECESRRIGKNILPTPFVEGMQQGHRILLYASQEKRVSRLVQEYTDGMHSDLEALITAIKSLKKRLGNQKVSELINLVEKGDFAGIARELLFYYDSLYKYPDGPSDAYVMSVCTDNVVQAADCIEEYVIKEFSHFRKIM